MLDLQASTQHFAQNHNKGMSYKLVLAAIAQFGGEAAFFDACAEMYDCSFDEKVWAIEPVAFYAEHRADILDFCGQVMAETGEDFVAHIIEAFGACGDDLSVSDVQAALKDPKAEMHDCVASVMSLLITEMVCANYEAFRESQEVETVAGQVLPIYKKDI